MAPHRSTVRWGLGRCERPARRGHFPTGLSVIALLALAASESSGAECPANTITAQSNASGANTHTTTASRDTASKYDSGRYCTDYCSSWYVDADATYDLVAGTMRAEVYASYQGVGDASVLTHDVFKLTGPGSVPPISFHARAQGGVASGCGYGPYAEADASIREGASNSASVSAQGWVQNCTGPGYDIGVSITRAAGSTFDLYLSVHANAGYSVYPGGGGDAHVSLSLSFPDLPAGYSVVSCQGFAAGQVVPTKRTSWGELKTRYR
jgi:hypothetical protein